MFVATLFVIARNWKGPTRPLIEECIRKMWSVYRTERYPAADPVVVQPWLVRLDLSAGLQYTLRS